MELCELGEDVSPWLPQNAELSIGILDGNMSKSSEVPPQRRNDQAVNYGGIGLGPQMDKNSKNFGKHLAERMSIRDACDGSGSPHISSALGLSSSSFRLPFASPGGLSKFDISKLRFPQFLTSTNDNETLQLSQMQDGKYLSDSTSAMFPSLSIAMDRARGDGMRDKIPSNLFHMSSPSLTPIQNNLLSPTSANMDDGVSHM